MYKLIVLLLVALLLAIASTAPTFSNLNIGYDGGAAITGGTDCAARGGGRTAYGYAVVYDPSENKTSDGNKCKSIGGGSGFNFHIGK